MYKNLYYISLSLAGLTFLVGMTASFLSYLIFPGYILAGIVSYRSGMQAEKNQNFRWRNLGVVTPLFYAGLLWLQFSFFTGIQ